MFSSMSKTSVTAIQLVVQLSPGLERGGQRGREEYVMYDYFCNKLILFYGNGYIEVERKTLSLKYVRGGGTF